MFDDLRNKLIDFLKVDEEVIEEEKPEPIIKLGDVWQTKPDGWVGTVQDIQEYVITSYNLEEDSIRITLRTHCEYDLKYKIITSKTPEDPFDPTRLYGKKDRTVVNRECSLEQLTNNLIKTDDNFLEIDALLGE